MGTFSSHLSLWLEKYRIHLLIFLVILTIGISFAHPGLLLTDEWVTVNQLDQIHTGHQVIINEGKYGTFENGTVSPYFTTKNNFLGYSLFLPLISLPAYWLLDLFGEHFVFVILCLWTLLLIAVAFLLNGFFKKSTYAGRWQWTTALFIAAFVLLFINFRYYLPFFTTGSDTYPEILAIVFTNIVLYALFAVFIFEINLTIFNDTLFSSFGSVVCISCSSYLFWTTTCKDHILTLFVFVLLTLMIVKYQKTKNFWHLSSAFISSGLLAWARPELALMACGALCLYTGYTFFFHDGGFAMHKNRVSLLVTPLFTLIGAIPFFINNYMVTGNALLMPFTLWDKEPSMSLVAPAASVQQSASTTFQPLFHIFTATTNFNLYAFPSDLYGILLNPQSGSIGVFLIAPIFMLAVFLAPILLLKKEFRFSHEEKQFSGIMGLLALAVFFTYVRGISGMNASPGIIPDIRYLSPIYLPLNILGLMVLKKLIIIPGNEVKTLWNMVAIWILSVPVSLIIISQFYPYPDNWSAIFSFLNGYTTVLTLIILGFVIISIIAQEFYQKSSSIALIFLAILCAIPFIWQVDASFLMRAFGSGLGGYSFWVPAVRMIFAGMFG
jgi:hypothetical protein